MDTEMNLEINRAFQKLAHDIIPDDEHIKNANICINNIVELLKRKSRFKIGQVCIAGSSGKKTTIFNSDMDCVLFINEEQPPFEDVLEDFENILTMTDSYKIRDVVARQYSIEFKSNNFVIDMLPAANIFPNCNEEDSDNLDDLQQQKVLDNLNIVFKSEYKFPQHQVLDSSRPRVMDPVNPYNNFAENWNEKSIKLMKQYAKETYRRLQLLAGRNRNTIRLDSVFDPQPPYLATFSEIFPYNAGIWLVGIYNYKSLKDLQIRNDKFWKDIRFSKGVEILKNYFQSMMHSVMASPNCNVQEVQDCVQNLISTHIINKPVKWSTATDNNHENYDITFTVPVASDKAVRISYRL